MEYPEAVPSIAVSTVVGERAELGRVGMNVRYTNKSFLWVRVEVNPKPIPVGPSCCISLELIVGIRDPECSGSLVGVE